MDARPKRDISSERAELLRQIPSVDELLAGPRLGSLLRRVDRQLVLEVTRAALAEMRERITGTHPIRITPLRREEIESAIADEVERILSRSLVPVINATGVILHTNLGRAPLLPAAAEEIRRAATRYSNLEYDLEAGARGKRDVHTSNLIERLTGAESAIVVNNCAAAVLLVLAALAKGGEAIVSRGELIEIGDGFRIPEIMAESGAILREVGTTNRTKAEDYERTINEKTRLLMRVHPSNFQISGFTDKPELGELVALSKKTNLPLVEDIGSGCMLDLSASGIQEPTVRQSVEAGVSLVVFSGDKLLGGPQAGIIAGKKELVQKIRRHPLFRALRVDKLTICALEATLGAYLRGAADEIPALHMLRTSSPEMARRADNFLRELKPQLPTSGVKVELVEGESLAGGGSTPAQSLRSPVIHIRSDHYSAADLERRLRRSPGAPVIARIEDDHLVVDLRTVFEDQEHELVVALGVALR
ncbi:MAG TPA: L-seryl-tRNA(Sec) selenium transferase [Candidatus Acidoferrum sp.]|nr:L-seryl-tRNA(Sec) selenium transferase [Candidatus Acidoferrum sp.]